MSYFTLKIPWGAIPVLVRVQPSAPGHTRRYLARIVGPVLLMRRTPDPDKSNGEIRTFECIGCNEQTEMRL